MAVSTALAGVRQRNIFGIYMENYDTYKQAISEAEKAEGTAALKTEAYNESIAYSINQLSVAWEGFAQKLEASGAIKLFFNILTDLVENLGQRLSQVVSLMVSFRSYKVTTDLKRLADFFGFEGTGTGRIKTGAINIWNTVTGKNAADKAAQEKEKYEQQRAGTYEEQSRNKVVNSNNKVVDALNRNAEALDRNSNAQNAKQVAQSAKPDIGPNYLMGARGVEQGTLSGKRVYKTASGQWKYYNNRPVTSGVENIKTIDAPAVADTPVVETNNRPVTSGVENTKKTAAPSQAILESGPQSKETDVSRYWLLGLTGSTVSRAGYFAAKRARKNIPLLEQQIKNLEATGNFDESTQSGLANTWELQGLKDQLEKDRGTLKSRDVRVQELKSNWKQGAIRGVGTGLAAGLVAGLSAEGDTQDKVVAGATTAITTGLLSAIPGVGAILGPILGPILGGFFGKEINKLLKADEVARKERVEDAKDNLEAIKGVSSSVTGLIDIRKKGDSTLWDADDWKQVNEYVESIMNAREANEGFKKAMDDAVKGTEGFVWTLENLVKDQQTLANVEAARIKYEAEQTYAAGEQDRYDLLKKIEESQKTLDTSTDEDEKEKAQAVITASKAAIQEYTDALNKAYMKSAFYSSGISTMSEAQKNTASIDRLVLEWAIAAQEAAKDKTGEKWLDDSGKVLSDKRSELIQQFRENGGYEAVLTSSEKSVRDYKNANNIANDQLEILKEKKDTEGNLLFKDLDMDKLKELVKTADGLERIKEALGEEKGARVIDAINDVDETKIATIAHSLNMTVEEFEKANANGDFDFFTTGMALENLDAFIERIDKLGDSFAELAVKGKLTGDSLNNIIKNYAFLLEGKGSFGAENIIDNLVKLYVGGEDSVISQALIGKFQSEAATNETWWNAWKNSPVAAKLGQKHGVDWSSTTFKTFEEAIGLMSKAERESFSEYAASLFNADIMDELNEKIIEQKTNAYDAEISNLQSIKDALGDINKQREKELELIKAKEALENASKEKVRVYREGMGFVYTTDQEAVRSAQEKVDELETSQTQDDLQYRIDILEQQKSILQNIEKNKELENLTSVVEKIQTALGDKSIFSQIVVGKETQGTLATTIADGIVEYTERVKEEKNIDAANKAAGELETAKSGLDKFLNESGSILNDPNNPAYNSTYAKYEEKWKNFVDKKSAFNEAAKAEGVNVGGDKNNIKNWENIKGYSGYIEKPKGRDENINYSIPYINWIDGNKIEMSPINSTFASSLPIASEEGIKNHMIGNNRSEKDRYIIARYDEDDQMWKFYKTSDTFSDLKKNLLPYDVVINDWNAATWLDRAVFVGDDGFLRWINADEGALGNQNSDWFNNDQWNTVYSNASTLPQKEGKDLLKGVNNVVYSQYASGSFSSTGGPSLINENGLESIITPQGTITSLPAKSGIVPADLTRNLWALGEVAPNLIARLGGSNLQTNNNVATNDNSINVDTLNATFNTTKDFDTQKFWMAVKNETILTKNNH